MGVFCCFVALDLFLKCAIFTVGGLRMAIEAFVPEPFSIVMVWNAKLVASIKTPVISPPTGDEGVIEIHVSNQHLQDLLHELSGIAKPYAPATPITADVFPAQRFVLVPAEGAEQDSFEFKT